MPRKRVRKYATAEALKAFRVAHLAKIRDAYSKMTEDQKMMKRKANKERRAQRANRRAFRALPMGFL